MPKIPTLAAASQAGIALRGETEPSRFAKQNARFYPKVIPYVGKADMERKSRAKLRFLQVPSFDFFQFKSL